MNFLTVAMNADAKTAALVIIAAFGAGLLSGLVIYFKFIRKKK